MTETPTESQSIHDGSEDTRTLKSSDHKRLRSTRKRNHTFLCQPSTTQLPLRQHMMRCPQKAAMTLYASKPWNVSILMIGRQQLGFLRCDGMGFRFLLLAIPLGTGGPKDP